MKVYGQLEKAQLENTTSDTASHPKGMITYRTDLNQAKVSNGTGYKLLIDEDSSQTLSNKTYATPSITGAITAAQTTTPANPSSGSNKLYFKADGKLYTLDSAGNEALVGSGTGGVKNLITNGNADDTSASIFVPYADAASTRPADGTGGSPTVTTSVSTSSPLDGVKSFLLTKPASNVQGQGWSVPFTVDPAYRAKALMISVDYIINSGTFVAGSTTTESDIIWYIYDVTNSQLIEPSTIKMFSNSTDISDKFEATFQSSATGSSYRLIAHVQSTSALAYELKVDNITVSPAGALVSDLPIVFEVARSATATGLFTTGSTVKATYDAAPTFDTVGAWDGTNNRYVIKVPGYYEIFGRVRLSASTAEHEPRLHVRINGTDTTQDVNLKSGTTSKGIDVTTFCRRYLNVGDYVELFVFQSSGASLDMLGTATVQANRFSIAMVSQGLGDSAGSSVGTELYKTTNQALVAGATLEKVTFDAFRVDSNAGFDNTNDRIVIKTSGSYFIYGSVGFANTTSEQEQWAQIRVNGSTINAESINTKSSNVSNGYNTIHTFTMRELKAGDYVELFGRSTSAGLNIQGTGSFGGTRLGLMKVTSPVIAAGETINARLITPTSQHNSTTTRTTGWVASIDSHKMWSTTNNEATVPISGTYQVCARWGPTNTAYSASIYIYKNGVLYTAASAYSNGNVDANPVVFSLMKLVAGDKISFWAQTSSATLTNTDTNITEATIVKVGN
jgi:hypothetical protein